MRVRAHTHTRTLLLNYKVMMSVKCSFLVLLEMSFLQGTLANISPGAPFSLIITDFFLYLLKT